MEGIKSACIIIISWIVFTITIFLISKIKKLKTIKVYLDDERETPEGWVGVKTVPELIDLFKSRTISEISLDHDLGEGQKTGYDFLCWLEAKVANDEIKYLPELVIHSANPTGRANMKLVIISINRFWSSENV